MVVYNFANKVGGGGAKPSYQLNMTTKLVEGSPKQGWTSLSYAQWNSFVMWSSKSIESFRLSEIRHQIDMMQSVIYSAVDEQCPSLYVQVKGYQVFLHLYQPYMGHSTQPLTAPKSQS